jgi:formylglycine-generating enzyme required for sulfatase activity
LLIRSLIAALVASTLSGAAVAVDWTTVGHPGNECDTQAQGCFGSVGISYQIGRYEVTNGQYAEFLNAVDPSGANELDLYHPLMEYDPIAELLFEFQHGGIVLDPDNDEGAKYEVKEGYADRPVLYVSFFDALRFANWLSNGQGTASTETGSYTLLGGTAVPSNGLTVTRNPGAVVVVPSEDEWYKAAYYHGPTASYFDYPAWTDTATACDLPGSTPNTANCDGSLNFGTLTDVGSYTGSPSPSGTYDQGGNVWEWNETRVGSERVLRGGGWANQALYLEGGVRFSFDPGTGEFFDLGFRVSSPSPACSNGIDDDGDGLADHPADPGCAGPSDTSEHNPAHPCDDGVDNDGDTLYDLADPGCRNPLSPSERPQCQDGRDNDGKVGIDFDGGALLDLDKNGFIDAQFNPATPAVGVPDPQCTTAWKDREAAPAPAPACGLGPELLLLTPLLALRARRRGARTRPEPRGAQPA